MQSEEIEDQHVPPKPYVPLVPFTRCLIKSKWNKSFSEIYDILSKVNVNLPLLDMIRNMSAYAKFFKELNTRKHKYERHEKVMILETASAVLQCKLPPKLKDLGSFVINITIGKKKEEKAMLDLGASINLMPYSIYQRLGLGELKPTTMTLQLVDRSLKYPRGIFEDILVQVDKLIVPVDVVGLDMKQTSDHSSELPILLGRPFMVTRTIIDVKNGKLNMTVLNQTIEFLVFNSMSLPLVTNNCFAVDSLDHIIVSSFLQGETKDKLAITLSS
ncbi:uncharacterized protein LOC116137414 [Pistacia vera]|uniref:uncharacterized protein LOC116137414 n=1 Tax=Pistacia vera TaxID=55513 RepID=UPI001262BDCE|nr:uncharacterized protein LOC116137414 [Pistacia vera]